MIHLDSTVNTCHIQRAHATSANVIVHSFFHFIPMAFLFFDDFMSLSGGVSVGLLGDATKSHPWRIWSWRIGCYQGLISRMFVAVSMKENDVLRKRACDVSTWKSREMNESALANFALEELAQMAKFKVGPSWACFDETRNLSCVCMFQLLKKCQVSRLTGKGGSQGLLSLPQSDLLSELMATLLLRPVFEVMPMKMKSCRRIAWSSGTEGQYDNVTMP